MSLLSPKNFVAPLQNKVAMGAILVIAVLVLVARLSGAAIAKRNAGADDRANRGYAKDQSAPADPRDREVATSIENFLGEKPGEKKAARAPQAGDDFLQDLLREAPAPAPAPTVEAAPKGLNDIRRSLGLE
jgi:hypothetical protein